MDPQLELFVAKQRSATPAQIAQLEAMLDQAGKWCSAAEIGAALKWTDRKVRAIASASANVVSWPGSPGYTLLKNCTVEEFSHYEAATQSQILRMEERLRRSRRVYHARGVAA